MFRSTLTPEQEAAIAAFLAGRHIPAGIGTKDEACSVASINLALSGKLTDEIPERMSPVIGRWIIGVQDAMPDALRNSDRWRSLLPLAAGTGREKEKERLTLVLDWMWEVLGLIQPVADRYGFGEPWATMLREKTYSAGEAAADLAAEAATYAAARAAAYAARASDAAAYAARAAADAAAELAAEAAAAELAAEAATELAAEDATLLISAEAATLVAAEAAARADFWDKADPCGMLERLINA